MIKFISRSQSLRRFAGCLILGLGAMTFVAADTAEWKHPSITTVQPAAAVEGTPVEIEGQNLSGVTKVTFGGKFEAKFKVNSDNEIEAIVPKEAGNGRITVVSADGQAKSNSDFVVNNSGN